MPRSTLERRVMTRVVRRAPDDTEHALPSDASKHSSIVHDVPHMPSQRAETAIDSFLAMQIGLWQVLAGLQLFSVDTKALLAGKREFRAFALKRVFFDWAEMKDDRVPPNSVTILQEGPTAYTYPGRETVLVESSVDKFCPGTVLKKSHTAEVQLQAIAWMGHKDDRGGLRRALEDAFDEPLDDRAGRRVVIPEYWEQTARYSLVSVDYQDDGVTASDNVWPLVATFSADIDVVKLVKRPGYIQGARPTVQASEDPIT